MKLRESVIFHQPALCRGGKARRKRDSVNAPLHVGDRLDLARLARRAPSAVVLYVAAQVRAEVAKVVVQVAREEGVLLGREDDLLRGVVGAGAARADELAKVTVCV